MLNIEPPADVSKGGHQITLSGRNFQSGATVLINGAPCVPIVVLNDTTATCFVPDGGSAFAAVDVKITSADGGSDTLTGAFTYLGVPVAWFDASDTETLETDGGALVSIWRDRSGRGNDVVQPSPAYRPTLVPNALNGHAALEFRAVSQYDPLTDGGYSYLTRSNPTGMPAGSSARTFSTVASFFISPLDARGRFTFGWGTNTPGQRFNLSVQTPSAERAQAVIDVNGESLASITVDAGVSFLFTFPYAAGTQLGANTLFINGAVAPTMYVSGVPIATLAAPLDIGRLADWDHPSDAHSGRIAELLIYATTLSGSERALLDAYLKAKYGL